MRRGKALLMLTLLAGPVTAEVTDAATAGFGVEQVREVPQAPALAWALFVEEVGRWWNGAHTWFGDASALSIEAEAGGCFCERASAGTVEHLRVGMAAPGRSLRLLGGLGPLQPLGVAGALSVDFEALEAGGSRVRLVYRVSGHTPGGLEAWAGPVDAVLGEQLERYAAHAAAAD
ncbi:MAG: hypothetical protein V2J24_09690 [Pseudomonadales bacterium]|nr:hypothetical protein [Pseudomonadales bacterium]